MIMWLLEPAEVANTEETYSRQPRTWPTPYAIAINAATATNPPGEIGCRCRAGFWTAGVASPPEVGWGFSLTGGLA